MWAPAFCDEASARAREYSAEAGDRSPSGGAAGRANPQPGCAGSLANAAEVNAAFSGEIAARQDQSVCRMVSNVLHELAIDGIAGPAARRSWPL